MVFEHHKPPPRLHLHGFDFQTHGFHLHGVLSAPGAERPGRCWWMSGKGWCLLMLMGVGWLVMIGWFLVHWLIGWCWFVDVLMCWCCFLVGWARFPSSLFDQTRWVWVWGTSRHPFIHRVRRVRRFKHMLTIIFYHWSIIGYDITWHKTTVGWLLGWLVAVLTLYKPLVIHCKPRANHQ